MALIGAEQGRPYLKRRLLPQKQRRHRLPFQAISAQLANFLGWLGEKMSNGR
jgi:hypothetical protein